MEKVRRKEGELKCRNQQKGEEKMREIKPGERKQGHIKGIKTIILEYRPKQKKEMKGEEK